MAVTIQAINESETPRRVFAEWCCIRNCSKKAEFVGTRHARRETYCDEHAKAFAIVNRIGFPQGVETART